MALQNIRAEGGATISRLGVDKNGGRVDALPATRATADVSAAMRARGWARPYDGGRRKSVRVTRISNQVSRIRTCRQNLMPMPDA